MPGMLGIGEVAGVVFAGPLRLAAGAGEAIPAGCGAQAGGMSATARTNAGTLNP